MVFVFSMMSGFAYPKTRACPRPAQAVGQSEWRKQISATKIISASHRLPTWSAMNRRKMNWALPAALRHSRFASAPIALRRHQASAKSYMTKASLPRPRAISLPPNDDYAQAFEKAPKDLRYKTARERTFPRLARQHVERGEKLRGQGDDAGAMTEFLRALEVDPSNALASQDIQALKEKLSTPRPEQETSVSPGEASQINSISAPVQLKPFRTTDHAAHDRGQQDRL